MSPTIEPTGNARTVRTDQRIADRWARCAAMPTNATWSAKVTAMANPAAMVRGTELTVRSTKGGRKAPTQRAKITSEMAAEATAWLIGDCFMLNSNRGRGSPLRYGETRL